MRKASFHNKYNPIYTINFSKYSPFSQININFEIPSQKSTGDGFIW